jgi:hypothetical protein
VIQDEVPFALRQLASKRAIVPAAVLTMFEPSRLGKSYKKVTVLMENSQRSTLGVTSIELLMHWREVIKGLWDEPPVVDRPLQFFNPIDPAAVST